MTELDQTWAESQIEAMADGSLPADAERRMLALMNRDSGLETRVEQARALRRELRELANVPLPRGLRWRLWRIPTADRRLRSVLWMPAGIMATAVVAVLGVNLYFGAQGPSADDVARTAAVQDFAVAVSYLQKSAVMARNEINESVGSGVLNALAISRGMIERSETSVSEGVQENVD